MNKYLSGKCVIIVAPAPTLDGLGLGHEIDSFDVIVRFHNSYLYPGDKKDYGSRTDILYCNGKFLKEKKTYLYKALANNKIKYLKKNSRIVLKNSENIQDFVSPVQDRLNIGVIAIKDLLLYDIKELWLSGYTFYSSEIPYYQDKKYMMKVWVRL